MEAVSILCGLPLDPGGTAVQINVPLQGQLKAAGDCVIPCVPLGPRGTHLPPQDQQNGATGQPTQEERPK